MPSRSALSASATWLLLALHADVVVAADPVPLLNAQLQSVQWNGIGRLSSQHGTHQCIATLLDTREPSGQSSGPAYVVTAAHCLDPRNGVVAHDVPAEGSVAFNYFIDTSEQRVTFALKQRVWSSMQGTDLALLELDASLQDVMAQGIEPLRLGERPDTATPVMVIGEPSVPDEGLRLMRCTQQRTSHAIEYPWVWRDIERNDCAGIAEGASGSPVISEDGQRLIAVINSVGVADSTRCERNSPCAFDHAEALTGQALNYAMPVQRLSGCWRQGRADLENPDCTLLPAVHIEIQERIAFMRKLALDANGQIEAPTWGMTFALDTPRYRYKTVQDPKACEDPLHYSGTIEAAQNRIDTPIGTTPGWYFLCLIGVEGADQRPSPGLMANSLSLPVNLLPAAPVPEPDVSIRRLEDASLEVTWIRHPPDLVRYFVKRGPPQSTDCESPSGYRRARHEVYAFKPQQLPLKLCTRGEDINGSHSVVRTDHLLPAP